MTKIQDDINARVTDEESRDVTFTVNDIIVLNQIKLNECPYHGQMGYNINEGTNNDSGTK